MEDVLTSGLSAKLMRYLRTRVLGDTNTSQRDGSHITENKNTPGAACMRGRDEGRSRLRLLQETNHLDDPRIVDEGLHDQSIERDHDRSIGRHMRGEESRVDSGEPPNSLDEDDIYEVDADGEDRWHVRDLRDLKTKLGDHDENMRDDSRRRGNRAFSRLRGKGRVNEGAIENEHALNSPGSGSRAGQGRSIRERGSSRTLDSKKAPDARKGFGRTLADGFPIEREDNDDRFLEFKVGSKDISDLVKKAVKAAEAEAKEANAPLEAIKAAGDAAAEVVKSAALEVCRITSHFLCSIFCFRSSHISAL